MASTDPERPNILFILSDDQGAWALGAAGNDDIITPNLDRLAADGVRAERFFCASPICSPARASLLTGQMPSQHGVLDFLDGRQVGPDGVDYLAGRTLVTQRLADDGYRCGLSGKWHLGANDKARTGFVHWYAHQGGSGQYFEPPMVRDGELVTEDRYVTDLISDDAISFIRRESERSDPFWLSVHYTAPHFPWADNHPEQYTRLYEDCSFESILKETDHPMLRRWHDGRAASLRTEPDERSALVGYFAAVTAMDAAVGRVLAELDALGLSESTLVVFTGDNGFNCGQHGIWGKGNGTYPQNMYDTSVLVPAIFRQPGRIPADRVVDTLLSAYDMAPTILEWVGSPTVAMPHSPGRSFADVLRDANGAGRDRIVVFDEYGPVRMIRDRQWKYVHRHPDGPHELYDLCNDPAERHNVAADPSHTHVVTRMRAQLHDWFSLYSDPENDAFKQEVSGWGQRAPIGETPFLPPQGPHRQQHR